MWLPRLLWLLLDGRRLVRAAGEVALALGWGLVLGMALTWPMALHMGQVIVGGGELGGWLWREWWHFQEIEALRASDLSGWSRLSALIALGRYPETGNILDVLLLSYPLDRWMGFPWHHDVKVLLILGGDAACGYALARSFTRSRLLALAAATVAVVNPLCIQDINRTGLRQVLLWWLLLYPVFLRRAARTGRARDGVLVGLCFVLVASFYWFYGLFAVLYTVIEGLVALVQRRSFALRRLLGWAGVALLVAGVGVLLFVMPYFSAGREVSGQGGTTKLPELTFFVPYPAYDTVAAAPLRPQTYRDNVLASLHRAIDSGWPADWVVNPVQGVGALPLVAFLVALLTALVLRRQALAWTATWLFFYSGSLGAFLKVGAMKDTGEVVHLGDYVVRLPYTWMFQYIPGMARMFAPYRMASMVVVATVALVAMGLERLEGRWRRAAGGLVPLLTALQPFYRFDVGPLRPGSIPPSAWRVPTHVQSVAIPEWYRSLDPNGWEGIIELPLEQQQDLISAYQTFHGRKVYHSWASEPAIPPLFRRDGGGEAGRRLRWLAAPGPRVDPVYDVLLDLSHDPTRVDLSKLHDEDLARLIRSGEYRWMVVHERGYFLSDPNRGKELYEAAVKALARRLGLNSQELVEFRSPGATSDPAWVPLASQEVRLPVNRMPSRYRMRVFDLAGRAHLEASSSDTTPAPSLDTDSPLVR